MGPLPDISWLFWWAMVGLTVSVIAGLGIVGLAIWYIARAIAFYNGWA